MITSSETDVHSIDTLGHNDKHYMCVSGSSDSFDMFEIKNGQLPQGKAWKSVKIGLIRAAICV